MKATEPLEKAEFFSTFVDELPQLYTLVDPTPVKQPELIAWSDDLGRDFGWEEPLTQSPDVDILGGNRLTPSMKPFSLRYGGHQFGNWAGQLGDGRAITLGEVKNNKKQIFEIQLKGSGLTPYSRSGDGRAVLRSSLREFLASEAMHHLGVPTTRALSLVKTGDLVLRDPFYDGNPLYETGAICTRMAPCFLRFGNFEILAAQGELENMSALRDWLIKHHYPELTGKEWFSELCRRTACMIVHWMRVGFVHGVMNTDNMSLLGLTIDYGPYGWLEPYDPSWTPNTTDLPGRRYAFGQQPLVAQWNLERLADALSLIMDEEDLKFGLQTYAETFNSGFLKMKAEKLGLKSIDGPENLSWLQDISPLLKNLNADMTLFYRNLSKVSKESSFDEVLEVLKSSFYTEPDTSSTTEFKSWLNGYQDRLKAENQDLGERCRSMNAVNPKYILRNYMLFECGLEVDKGNLESIEKLMTLLKSPYAEQPEFEVFAAKRPEWAANQPGSSTLSCSS